MKLVEAVETKFRQLFGGSPLLVRSPGRVNLIGEHTDYNMGYVLPGAIDKAIYFAIGPRTDSCCNVFAVDMNEAHQFTLDDMRFAPNGWPNYLMGVVDQFLKRQFSVNGFNCVFGGDIPIGAGLSSSAALEAGLAFALNRIFDLGMDNLSIVRLAQKAENEFVGVQCGIMDQYVCVFGEPEKVLRIDCRTLEHEYYPFNQDVSIVLFDTRVSHSLASSEYNRRREECGQGVEIIRQTNPEVTHLRDVSLNMLDACRNKIDATTFRRCKYVIEENNRVLKACRALEENDLKTFGSLMYQSHTGLSTDYEVSCRELDFLVELVKDDPHVYGARMMGGGFGGCTINLIEKQSVELICERVRKDYRQKFDIEPRTFVTSIGSGTRVVHAEEDAHE